MISTLHKFYLAIAAPLAIIAALSVYNYFKDRNECAPLRGAEQLACLERMAAKAGQPTIEQQMFTCSKAELFLTLYKADERTRKRYPENEVIAQYNRVCKA